MDALLERLGWNTFCDLPARRAATVVICVRRIATMSTVTLAPNSIPQNTSCICHTIKLPLASTFRSGTGSPITPSASDEHLSNCHSVAHVFTVARVLGIMA